MAQDLDVYQHHDGATHMHGKFVSLILTCRRSQRHLICGAADGRPTGPEAYPLCSVSSYNDELLVF